MAPEEFGQLLVSEHRPDAQLIAPYGAVGAHGSVDPLKLKAQLGPPAMDTNHIAPVHCS